MTITIAGGHKVDLADWIDDKVYSTVALSAAGPGPRRPPPLFGELPGDGARQYQHRWPDILRWYVNNREPVVAHDVLHELRSGARRMTRMLADTLVTGLHVCPQDRAALIDMITSTHFGDADSEWALANLIDAAVGIAAAESPTSVYGAPMRRWPP